MSPRSLDLIDGAFRRQARRKAKAPAEVDAWVAGAAAAEVSTDSWTGPFFMSVLAANTYTVRTHDSLIARLPDQSVLIGGLNERCTVPGVVREDAPSIGRLLISWWEERQMGEAGSSPLSGLSLEIGGRHDDPEITYTVDPCGRTRGTAGGSGETETDPAGRRRVDRKPGRFVTAARLDLRPGYAIEFQFLPPGFDPHLLVIERATGVWNKEETARTGEAIRSHNPASAVRTF